MDYIINFFVFCTEMYEKLPECSILKEEIILFVCSISKCMDYTMRKVEGSKMVCAQNMSSMKLYKMKCVEKGAGHGSQKILH